MKRTPGSWPVGQTDIYEVAFDFKGGEREFIRTADRGEAERIYREARDFLIDGTIAPDWMQERFPGRRPTRAVGVYRYRTLVEKIKVKGISWEEQRP